MVLAKGTPWSIQDKVGADNFFFVRQKIVKSPSIIKIPSDFNSIFAAEILKLCL